MVGRGLISAQHLYIENATELGSYLYMLATVCQPSERVGTDSYIAEMV